MPTLPKNTPSVKEMGSVNILNAINNDLGGDYASRVPLAISGDIKSLNAIGNVLMNFEPLRNAFLNALVNRIGCVVITSKMYENPWANFKKGILEYGETIEEIFVQLAKPYQFNPEDAENTLFKRYIPDVKSAFHTMNYQKFYPTTVSNYQLRQAFLSFEGITDLISRIIEQVYTAANYDEFLVMKYMIARQALNGNIHSVNIPAVNKENASEVTTAMVEKAKDLAFFSDKYNYAGVKTVTNPTELYTILTNKISSIFDVQVLALAFHMEKAELLGRQVGVDSFGELDNERLTKLFKDDPYTTFTPFNEQELAELSTIMGLMVDVKWFMVYDNFIDMTEVYNGKGLYWTYFYHVWKTFSISPFANAVLFTTEQPVVTSVTVSPETAKAGKGTQLQLTATVITTGFADKGVHWEISGSETHSTVSQNGLVIIGTDETESSITVTATSLFDESKKATCTITIA